MWGSSRQGLLRPALPLCAPFSAEACKLWHLQQVPGCVSGLGGVVSQALGNTSCNNNRKNGRAGWGCGNEMRRLPRGQAHRLSLTSRHPSLADRSTANSTRCVSSVMRGQKASGWPPDWMCCTSPPNLSHMHTSCRGSSPAAAVAGAADSAEGQEEEESEAVRQKCWPQGQPAAVARWQRPRQPRWGAAAISPRRPRRPLTPAAWPGGPPPRRGVWHPTCHNPATRARPSPQSCAGSAGVGGCQQGAHRLWHQELLTAT